VVEKHRQWMGELHLVAGFYGCCCTVECAAREL
jgi:hypothetical protein